MDGSFNLFKRNIMAVVLLWNICYTFVFYIEL